MVSERDTHGGGDKENQKEAHLKPIEPVMPKIQRKAREGHEQGDDEEKACRPVDSVKRNSRHSLLSFSRCGALAPRRKN